MGLVLLKKANIRRCSKRKKIIQEIEKGHKELAGTWTPPKQNLVRLNTSHGGVRGCDANPFLWFVDPLAQGSTYQKGRVDGQGECPELHTNC